MRIRQIKPDFWSDKTLAGLDAETRLFFIGLWMEADDDGYLQWEPDQIAARLWPYKGVAARERFIRAAVLRLADMGSVRILECGRHVTVPGLPKHQVVASTRRVVRTHGEHNVQCVNNGAPSGAIERTSGTVGNGKVGDGTEVASESTGAGTREDAGAHESAIDELQRILNDVTSTIPAKRAAKKALERLGIDIGDYK